jgi:hypothetical protein
VRTFVQMDAMPSKKITDWDAIRAIYEQGRLSNRALARRYAPLTEGAVRKRAKAESWVRPKGARIARPAPIVRRAERPRREHWRNHEPAARRVIVDHRDSAKPRRRNPEDVVDLGELVLVELAGLYKIIMEHRELLLEILENCVEDYRVPHGVHLKMRKHFEILDLSRQMRNLAETSKIFVSTRQMWAGLGHQRK